MKSLTRDELESRKEKAVRFTQDVLGDPDRAEDIADESLEDFFAGALFSATLMSLAVQ